MGTSLQPQQAKLVLLLLLLLLLLYYHAEWVASFELNRPSEQNNNRFNSNAILLSILCTKDEMYTVMYLIMNNVWMVLISKNSKFSLVV